MYLRRFTIAWLWPIIGRIELDQGFAIIYDVGETLYTGTVQSTDFSGNLINLIMCYAHQW